MQFKNSYIFLKRKKENNEIKRNSQNKNKIMLTLPPSFKELLKNSFTEITFDNKDNTLDIVNTGTFKIDYNNESVDINFKYHNVWSNYYLDIIVNSRSKRDAVNILEIINSILIGEKNKFDEKFVSIVSYDCISEYYCNKLFPLLNEFERKLRKILFNIYTLNFNLDYYSATTSEDFQKVLKQKSNIYKTENISKNDCYIKLGFYSLDYNDIDTLLFTKSITPEEINKVQTFLNDNKDLTKLSDAEIRKFFYLCNYKTDWDRFFENKKFDENFQEIFNDIRVFRNNIAHCKFISKIQYKNCLKILRKTNKSLDTAIKITEEHDFITKNIELQNQSFERLAKTMHETIASLYKPIIENINAITEPLKQMSNKLKEIVKPIDLSNLNLPKIQLPEIELPKFNMTPYFEDEDNKNIEGDDNMFKINDKEYEEISSTAIVTSYPRIFTDIPYEKEIYEWLSNHCNEEVTLNKMLAAEIEARYKLTNKLLDNSGIKQVLELAAGYSSRGLIYSNKGYNYVEMDLEKVIQNKTNIVNDVEKNIPNSLNIISGNALRSSDYLKCDEYFEPNKPIAVINEGLLRYLTFDEKRIVAENVYSFLKKHGGIWITCDVTPKKFIQSQDKALPNFNKNLNNVTSRNNITDRFENIEHIKEFFGNIGFEVSEIHKFSEVKDELYSINYHNLVNSNIEQSLDDAIVAVMKIKEEF